jgi:hypothetical protein
LGTGLAGPTDYKARKITKEETAPKRSVLQGYKRAAEGIKKADERSLGDIHFPTTVLLRTRRPVVKMGAFFDFYQSDNI